LHKLSTQCNAKSRVQTKSTSDAWFDSRIGLPVIEHSCSIPRASLSEWLGQSAKATRKMLRSTLIVTLCFSMAPTLLAQSPPALNLIPMPARVQPGTGRLAVNQTFAIGIDGPSDDLLRRAAQRFMTDLARQTGIPMSSHGFDPAKAVLVIHSGQASKAVQELEEDESYTLDVTGSAAKLTAPATLGILHGLQTFLQLVEITPDGFYAPAVHIEDSARFPWRGLSIDVSRHFIPIEVLKRNIDGMAYVKLNVFHWHLSDDQGFRVESKAYPKLHELGSDGFYYTQAEVRDLIAYAHDRGIRVVPEFDIPGHTSAWFAAYPALASAPGPYTIERRWGIFDPAMDPTRTATFQFLDKFIGEMAALFPDRYFHIGGDEVNGRQWDANPQIQAFMRAHNIKTDVELQQYFTVRVQKIVSRHGKTMIGWDEILAPNIPKSIVIESWRGQDSLAAAARQGYRGLLAHGYYLDAMWTAAQHYAVDPLSDAAAGLTPEEQKLILGGEACVWGEFVTADNIDSRIWPRTAAIAERFWSPQFVKDVNSMYQRLDALQAKLVAIGISPESGMEAMLIRAAGTSEIGPLRVLAAVVAPSGLADREQKAIQGGGIHTSDLPLNRMSDAVAPESGAARRFATAVNALIANKFADRAVEAQVRACLTNWSENDARLAPMLANSYLLKEVAPLSQQLSAVAAAGLEALDYAEHSKAAPADWIDQRLSLSIQAQKSQADLLLMVAHPVELLLRAVPSDAPK